MALLPQRIKTIGSSLSLSKEIILSVNISQPLPLCEFASPALTVSTVFNKSTPWSAHFFK